MNQQELRQVCYTHLMSASGWSTVNTINSTRELIQVYETFSKNCNVEEEHAAVICKGDYIGLSYSEYHFGGSDEDDGAGDAQGRDWYFCQGLFWDGAYERLKKPNDLLSLKKENFRRTLKGTETLPENLALYEDMTVESAMKTAGVTWELYKPLMEAVYLHLALLQKPTVTIVCDPDEKIWRAVLYLIYSALPYSLRPLISMGNHKLNMYKVSILFEKENGSGLFINLKTGENSLEQYRQNDDTCSRYADLLRAGIYYLQKYGSADRLFNYLEEILCCCGDKQESDLDVIRLVFLTKPTNGYPYHYKDENLYFLFIGWMDINHSHNMEYVREQRRRFFKMIVDRGIVLWKKDIEKVEAVLREPQSDDSMKELYLRYRMVQLSKGDAAKACKEILDEFKNQDEKFRHVKEILKECPGGEMVLDQIFIQNVDSIVNSQISNADQAYQEVLDFAAMYRNEPAYRNVIGQLVERCQRIAIQEVEKKETKFKKIKEQFKQTLEKIGAVYHPENLAPVTLCIKKTMYEAFDAERLSEYEMFFKDIDSDRQEYEIWDFLDCFGAYSKRERFKCANGKTAPAFQWFMEYEQRISDPTRYPDGKEKYQKWIEMFSDKADGTWVEAENKDVSPMHFWASMAEAMGDDLFEYMIRKGVWILKSLSSFKQSLEKDPYWNEGTNLKDFCRSLAAWKAEKRPVDSPETPDALMKTAKEYRKDVKDNDIGWLSKMKGYIRSMFSRFVKTKG